MHVYGQPRPSLSVVESLPEQKRAAVNRDTKNLGEEHVLLDQ